MDNTQGRKPRGRVVGDATLIAGNQAAVADGDPVGVARQVSEHGCGTGEGALGVDHPVDGAQWSQVVGEFPDRP